MRSITHLTTMVFLSNKGAAKKKQKKQLYTHDRLFRKKKSQAHLRLIVDYLLGGALACAKYVTIRQPLYATFVTRHSLRIYARASLYQYKSDMIHWYCVSHVHIEHDMYIYMTRKHQIRKTQRRREETRPQGRRPTHDPYSTVHFSVCSVLLRSLLRARPVLSP